MIVECIRWKNQENLKNSCQFSCVNNFIQSLILITIKQLYTVFAIVRVMWDFADNQKIPARENIGGPEDRELFLWKASFEMESFPETGNSPCRFIQLSNQSRRSIFLLFIVLGKLLQQIHSSLLRNDRICKRLFPSTYKSCTLFQSHLHEDSFHLWRISISTSLL